MTVRSCTRRAGRRLLLLLLGILLPLQLTACAGRDGGGGGGDRAAAPAEKGALPAKVATKFGTVTLRHAPRRVVALGWGDAETALALGVQPVGASDWLGFGGDGVGPWAKGRYDKAPTMIGTLEPEWEKVAALKPDVILDVKSAGDAKRHRALSKIAPTVSVPKGGEKYRTSWRRQVRMVAEALGRPGRGKKLISGVEGKFREAARAHPEFHGRTVAVGARSGRGYGAYVRGDGRVDFMEALGFRNKPAVQKQASADFSVPVSDEKLGLLDADLTLVSPIGVRARTVTRDPLFKALPSVEDGRSVVFDDKNISSAFAANTALSLPYALKKVVPLFAHALGNGSKGKGHRR